MKKLLALIAFSVLLLVPVGTQNAFALTESFTNLGTFTTPELIRTDFTVTGSNDIRVLEFNGLGIVGGSSDSTIDINESITFTFNTNVINVSYIAAFGVAGNVEAFNPSGVSLGTAPIGAGAGFKNISALFGDVPISKFTFTATSNGGRISSISYDFASSDTELILTELQQINQRLDDLEGDHDTLAQLIQNIGSMAVGGIMIPVDAVVLLAAAIGVDPLITGLLVLSMVGVSAQVVWLIHRKKKKVLD